MSNYGGSIMTTNTQRLRESAEKAKAFATHLTPTHPETAKAHINGLADLVCICCDELDALRAENERMRDALVCAEDRLRRISCLLSEGHQFIDRGDTVRIWADDARAALQGESK